MNIAIIKDQIHQAMLEDLRYGDITTELLVSRDKLCSFVIRAKGDMILCGTDIMAHIFLHYGGMDIDLCFKDGYYINDGAVIAQGRGEAHNILACERVALNYLQHLSGVATFTKKFVDKIQNTNAKICATRKTIPGIRCIQKYAVQCGGGMPHRFDLSSCVLIKNNHLKNINYDLNTIKKIRLQAPHNAKIIIECEEVELVMDLAQQCDILMLDNMNIEQIAKSIELLRVSDIKVPVEVSGGVNLSNVYDIAKTGVSYISIGMITHSAPAVDISLQLQ